MVVVGQPLEPEFVLEAELLASQIKQRSQN